MLNSFDKLNQTEACSAKYWPVYVAALYGAGIIAVLVLTIARAHC